MQVDARAGETANRRWRRGSTDAANADSMATVTDPTTPSQSSVVYLTGGSGYLGREVVRLLEQGGGAPVYIPVRNKKSSAHGMQSGAVRFNQLYPPEEGASYCVPAGGTRRIRWADPGRPIPPDTEVRGRPAMPGFWCCCCFCCC